MTSNRGGVWLYVVPNFIIGIFTRTPGLSVTSSKQKKANPWIRTLSCRSQATQTINDLKREDWISPSCYHKPELKPYSARISELLSLDVPSLNDAEKNISSSIHSAPEKIIGICRHKRKIHGLTRSDRQRLKRNLSSTDGPYKRRLCDP